MLSKDTQDKAAIYAVGSLRRSVTLTPAVHPHRRYRFELVKVETVLSIEAEDVGGEEADAQKGERLTMSEYGAEWRAGYYSDKRPGGVESRFFPWHAVLEVRGETGIVLEYRNPPTDELERWTAIDDDGESDFWADHDRFAEDWTVVSDETSEALEALAAEVLRTMSEAARVAAETEAIESSDAEG